VDVRTNPDHSTATVVTLRNSSTDGGVDGGGPRSAFPQALTKRALEEHTERDEEDRADRRRRGIAPGEREETEETEETEDTEDDVPEENRGHRSRSRRDPKRRGSRSRKNSDGNMRRGSRKIGRSESKKENRKRRPSNVKIGNVSTVQSLLTNPLLIRQVLGEGIVPSPGPMTGKPTRRATHFLDSNGDTQPVRRRRTGSRYERVWDNDIGKWVRVKDPRRGSMDTHVGRPHRRRTRNGSRRNSRRDSVRRSSSVIPRKKQTRNKVGFQDIPRRSSRSASGSRRSSRRASRLSELENSELTAREYRLKSKEKATKKLLEAEAAENKERDEKYANAPKPKDDIFDLRSKKERQGTGAHILRNWVMYEANDEMDAKGTGLANGAGGFENVESSDRRKVGDEDESVEWVAVRDQNNKIVHIKASQLQTKTDANKIGDIDKKDDLTEGEKKMKTELEAMDKELAKINKDEGAVLDSDVIETRETREADGKRLQEMRERLNKLRQTKDDEAIRRMEARLAAAQLKHDHRELAVDDDGNIIGGDVPHKAPDFPEKGVLGDSDSGIRRRRTSIYPLGTHLTYNQRNGRADTFTRFKRRQLDYPCLGATKCR
jgi:hypothetical protein